MAIALALPAGAQDTYKSSELLAVCKAGPGSEGFMTGCLFFLARIADAMDGKPFLGRQACLGNASLGELRAAVTAFLDRHPKRQADPAESSVAEAFQAAFPCATRPPR